MSTNQYALNLGLLVLVLRTGLGTHTVTAHRFLRPIGLAAAAGYLFLGGMSTAGNDLVLELLGVVIGLVLGGVAAALVSVDHGPGSSVVMRAGAGYAALWVAVVGGRIIFAYGADHWFSRPLAHFSMQHEITGSGPWTAAFVLMALAMVTTRALIGTVQIVRLGYARPVTA